MSFSFYSKHFVTDGKWEAAVFVTETGQSEIVDRRPALKALLDQHYSDDAVTIAQALVTDIDGAFRADVGQFFGPVVIATKDRL